MRLEDLKGRRLGRYEIAEVLGRGGMAAVYRARDTVLRRDVALKILYPQYAGDAALVERFQREAVLAAGLDHPNILPIYDVGDADGLVYIAMRLLSGRSFADVLRLRGSLPPEELLPIIDQIASALDYAHARQIVHRDIKPANILIEGMDDQGMGMANASSIPYLSSSSPHAVLTDFGIAKSLDPAASGLTVTGVLIGTPEYMAPEQIRGEHTVDGRADIYALGVLVYRALTGRRPFEGGTEEVLLGHLRGTIAPPSSIDTSLAPALNAVILKALARDSRQRYRTAGEFARALRSAAGIELPTPPPALRRSADGRAVVPSVAVGQLAGNGLPIDAQPTQRGDAAPRSTARQSPLTSAEPTRRGEAAPPYVRPSPRTSYDPPPRSRRGSNIAWAIVGLMLALLLGGGVFYGARMFASGSGGGVAIGSTSPVTPTTPPATSPPAATATAQSTEAPSATSAPTAPATAEPSPTATNAPKRTPTARPRTTPVPVPPTSAPTAPATAEPSPTATSAPTPTPTVAETPTQTLTPTPCAVEPAAELATFLTNQTAIASQLGCPTQDGQSRPIAEQNFERGAMLWVAGPSGRNGTIYVVVDDEPRARTTWLVFEDTWQEGDPPDSGDATPPNGRYEPQRGFGKLWYANQDIATAIGWAKEETETGGTGVVQRFTNGRLIYSSIGFGAGPSIYVLDQDGVFTSFKAPS